MKLHSANVGMLGDAKYCIYLHSIKWYCMVYIIWYCMVRSCMMHNTGVLRSEDLKKVVCLACWIYTGTLWQKELLSELTKARLGMWIVYPCRTLYHVKVLSLVSCVTLMPCVIYPEFEATEAWAEWKLKKWLVKSSFWSWWMIQGDKHCCNYNILLLRVIYESITKMSNFHFLGIWMNPTQKRWTLLLLDYSVE